LTNEKPATASTAVEQAYDALLAFVEASQDGARLPSERKLAATLGVSRSTLRTATDRLVRFGFLEIRRGAGTIVRRPATPDLGLPYREILGRSLASHEQVIELRSIVEPHLAALAAQRRSASEQRTITRLASSANSDFYEAVASASHNPAASSLVALLLSIASTKMDETGSEERAADYANMLGRQRAAVASAIAASDSIAARESMVTHLSTIARGPQRPVDPGGD